MKNLSDNALKIAEFLKLNLDEKFTIEEYGLTGEGNIYVTYEYDNYPLGFFAYAGFDKFENFFMKYSGDRVHYKNLRIFKVEDLKEVKCVVSFEYFSRDFFGQFVKSEFTDVR